jgi:hypothetical protein
MSQQGPMVLDPISGKYRILTQEELRQLLVTRRAWEILHDLLFAVPLMQLRAAVTIAESKALAEGELARKDGNDEKPSDPR